MPDLIQIPTAQLNAMSRTMLIREWWYTYRLALEKPGDFATWHKRLNALGKEMEGRGIVTLGAPMPRDGAEDLAHDVDDFKRRRGIR